MRNTATARSVQRALALCKEFTEEGDCFEVAYDKHGKGWVAWWISADKNLGHLAHTGYTPEDAVNNLLHFVMEIRS